MIYHLVMQTEMMSDAIDDALDNDEAEEETEELTNQVRLVDWVHFSVKHLMNQNLQKDKSIYK